MSGSELLDCTDEVGAVRLPDLLEHPVGSVVSQLLVQGACEGLLLSFAPLKGGISHGLRGTGAAQVGFGGCCRALRPLISELLNIGGQRRWNGRLDLR